MTSICTSAEHTNRLVHEESPYLKQHQHNPVDWYPWGQEAFEKARADDRPIFLSIGYSTCHWCHVMERESFEDQEAAQLLNSFFVAIKVDREERPDVDKVYMTYVQATSGGGGWPLSVFLTPSLEPFLGGTYFPPADMYGRPGFKTVLQRVAEVWRQRKDEVKAQSADAMKQLEEATRPSEGRGVLPNDVAVAAMDSCAAQLASRFDKRLGGFGGAPKFPRPAELNLLLHHCLRLKAEGKQGEARGMLDMALFSMRKMAEGGVYDHIGGGFHRYSVDEWWHVPHFEKMLYDNPQLASTYLSAFQATGQRHLAQVARGVLDYLIRDMTHPEGGLYAAEDADSLDESSGHKSEGAFYLWTKEQVVHALGGGPRCRLFCRHYNVRDGGNCTLSPRSDPHHEFEGRNVLITLHPLEDSAREEGMSVEDAEKLLGECREILAGVRNKRPRPHRDEKVVTAWNGMSISAFALAFRALKAEHPPLPRSYPVEGVDPSVYLAAAVKAAHFVRNHLWNAESSKLRRSFMVGPSAVEGFADDYAYMVAGLIDLFSVTGQVEWLEWAVQLQDRQDALFWDDAAGGYFNTAAGQTSILLRMKEDYDGAEPAASSVAAGNLFRLAALAGRERSSGYRERGLQTVAAFRERLEEVALALPLMCCAAFLQQAGHLRQVVVAGKLGSPDMEALLDAVHAPFVPDKVVVALDLSNDAQLAWWRQFNPEMVAVVEVTGMSEQDPATAFICQNFTCRAPTTDPQRVKQLLQELPARWHSGRPHLGSVDLSTLGRGS